MKRGKKTPRQKLIDLQDDKVRQRLKDEAPKICVTCGRQTDWYHPRDNSFGLQVGHYVSRDIKQLRWHPKNVAPQCAPCNWEHEKNPAPYTLWMIKTYGIEIIEEFDEIRRQAKGHVEHLGVFELEEIYEKQNDGSQQTFYS